MSGKWFAALGQVGAGQPQVIDALLAQLTDADVDVRQAVIKSLTEVSSITLIGPHLERLLLLYEPIAHKQFRVDALVDDVLSALLQIVGNI